jgi:recombinational DNA repair protein RecT
MWIDMAGGMVANIGKDNNNNSVVMSTGGNFIMQVGGFTVLGDSRFSDTSPNSVQQSIISSAVLDLRIMTSGGFCHMIRCDDNGITIMTPNALKIHATGNMTLTSDQNISIECENLKLQNRVVNKESGGSI